MRIGVMIDTEVPFERVISQVASLRDAGIQTAWASQIFAYDALTALAAIGREVDGIDLGTAVVPTYPRHPVMMAGQALTVQAATGGRLILGIGLLIRSSSRTCSDSHSIARPPHEGVPFGSHASPRRRAGVICRRTLRASTSGPLQIDAPPPPVLVAALRPTMLRLAGTLASGTITWMTGPDTMEAHIIPTINQAATEAGRPKPQVESGSLFVWPAIPFGSRQGG